MSREEAAARLSSLLAAALRDAGIDIEACELTEDVQAAHLLIWVEGGPPPAIPGSNESTFLALPEFEPPPQTGVTPPTSGNAGLKAAP